MTPFEQFVFFLSSAQEDLYRFLGQEQVASGGAVNENDVIPPGKYRVQGDVLCPVEDKRPEAAKV